MTFKTELELGVFSTGPSILHVESQVSLLVKGWIPERAINGNSGKNQWARSDIGKDNSFDGHEMMLNTDLCLAFSNSEKQLFPLVVF